MRKKISALVCLALVGVLLVSALPALGQGASLSMIWWGGQTRHDGTIAVIEMYEEATGVSIEYEFSGWGDYWTLVNTKAAGDELPCIMQQDYRFLNEWNSRGLLVSLNPYMESGVIDTTNIPDGVIAGGLIDGEMYGINLGNNSQAFMLDVDAFEAANVELPPLDWTWAQFEETAIALHDALGIWGFGYQLWDGQLLKSVLLSYGVYMYEPDGSGIGYEDDQLIIDYFERILRLQEAGAIPTLEEWYAEWNELPPEADALAVDRGAMTYKWSNQVVAVWTGAGEDANIRLYHIPRPEDGTPANFLKPSMFFSITDDCPNPEDAAAFISFFVNDLEANEILFAERGVPVSTVVLEHLTEMAEPAQAEMFDFIARVTEDGIPVPPADPAGTVEADDNVYQPLFLEPVLYGQITPAEGAAILREEVNRVFAEVNG